LPLLLCCASGAVRPGSRFQGVLGVQQPQRRMQSRDDQTGYSHRLVETLDDFEIILIRPLRVFRG
jgi:hypothetical protein